VKILRVFNNNVVLARDPARGEVILTGRGLGFQARPGQPVDPTKVVKVFIPDEGRDPDNFGQLVAAIPPEHLLLADQALEVIRLTMRVSSSSSTVVALADHLSFAIKRVLKGIQLEYPLHAEVAHLYPDELAVAERIVAYVNERITMPLPAEEAVPIALHLVNAGFSSGDLSFTYQMTGVFQQLFDVLEKAFDRTIDRDTVNAARFITHLRYFFVRAHNGRQLSDGAPALTSAIRTSYPREYFAATRLQAVLELRLGTPLTEDEITYLTLHVARMIDEVRV
jgi:beta-glucoside operon transcriptional antiterminator